MILWFNGALYTESAGLLDALDHGVTVGDGVFETCEVRAGRAFALTRHIERLQHSAAGLGLDSPAPERVREAVRAVEEEWVQTHGPDQLGRLRITWTAGPGPLGSERTPGAGTLMVAAGPTPAPAPVRVRIVPWTRNENSAVAGLKTTSYAENVKALARAADHGDGEAIFANTKGELCEGTGTNIFLDDGEALITPPLASGCLAGITRALVLEWAGSENITVVERDLSLEDLRQATHAALTSSTRGIVPISAVDGRELAPGDLTLRMSSAFTALSAEQVDP